jgi:hypothetical protein
MAGRNKAKLLEVQQQLAKYDPNIMEVCRSVMFWGFVRTFGGLPRTQAAGAIGQWQPAQTCVSLGARG